MNYIKEVYRRYTTCYETSNPRELIDLVGIQVGYLPNDADIDNFKGCYKMINGNKIILINPNLDGFSKKEVLTYGLSHALLYPTHDGLFLASYSDFGLSTFDKDVCTLAAEFMLNENKDKLKNYNL